MMRYRNDVRSTGPEATGCLSLMRRHMLVTLLALCTQTLHAAEATRTLSRVKDVASIEGIRDNQLVGYGIVVGLKGTGDSQQTVFPIQTLKSALLRMGVNVSSGTQLRVQNMASVFVSATLPPFSRPGEHLDVTVAAAGDARSIEGGLLLMTPLYGPDGQVYAEAQGPLLLGGYSVSANGTERQMNHPTTARVPGGGMVERAVELDLTQLRPLTVLLNDADFYTAEGAANSINREIGDGRAHAIDSRRIQVRTNPGEDIPLLLAKIEAAQVSVSPRARVVMNERTGTVVIGGSVKLGPVSILHGGLTINVVTEFQVSQPNSFGKGETVVVPQTQIDANDRPVNRIELKQGATVDDLVQNLQRIGASARDVISILQAMKQAGALEAELEVL